MIGGTGSACADLLEILSRDKAADWAHAIGGIGAVIAALVVGPFKTKRR